MPIYNRHTVFNKRGKPPIIRIDVSGNNARITFSVEAVKMWGLKEDDCLSIFINEKERDLIFFRVDNENGIPLKVELGFKTGVRMGLYCRQLARAIAKHIGLKVCRSFIISNEKVKADGREWFFIDKYKTYAGRYKPNSKIN